MRFEDSRCEPQACRLPDSGLDCGVPTAKSARIAVFASGEGSNFEVLVEASRRNELGGDVVALFCDNLSAPAIERARRLEIEVVTPPAGPHRTRLADEGPWLEALREHKVDLVLLAGFMRRLHAPMLAAFGGRMLNIHPSLLPSFPGLDAIEQAWRHGVRVTGCTVHMVEEALDDGLIVAQKAVDVREDDTPQSLEARVHAAEHAIYAPAVRRFLTQPWQVDGRRLVFVERRND